MERLKIKTTKFIYNVNPYDYADLRQFIKDVDRPDRSLKP